MKIEESENIWIKYTQQKHYGDVINSMKQNKRNKLQHQLNLYTDDDSEVDYITPN